VNPAQEQRSGIDRRTGFDRRSGMERRVACSGSPRILPRLFPHTPFSERDVADRSRAIEAYRGELSSRLGRDVGLLVAALDYLLNVSRHLGAPTIVEHEVLEVLEYRAVTDPLTGLFNRYHFEAALKQEVARCRRYGERLSLLLIDVDQLKAVNDRWGHPEGDRMLGRVADAIRSTLRTADVATRYGGDEFAIILPDADAPAAQLVAERICANVAASVGEGGLPGGSTTVTVSGGFAELPLGAPAVSEAQFVLAADQALYLAKGRGGNCVEAASSFNPVSARGEASPG